MGGTPNSGGGAGDDPGPAPTTACTFTPDADGFFQLTSPKSDYWVRLPSGYDAKAPTAQRLLVGVHGCGDTAKEIPLAGRWRRTTSALARTTSRCRSEWRDSACWTVGTDTELVTQAIAHVRTCFFVHQKKVVLAGYSSGGMCSPTASV